MYFIPDINNNIIAGPGVDYKNPAQIECPSWPLDANKNPINKKYCKWSGSTVVEKTAAEKIIADKRIIFTEEQKAEIKRIAAEK